MWEGEEALKKVLQDHPMGHACWGKLIRRDFLRGARFEEGRCLTEDGFFIFELCLRRPIFLLSQSMFYGYRVVCGSASRSPFSEKYLDILYFARKRIEIVRKDFPSFTCYAQSFWVKSNMQMLFVLAISPLNKKNMYFQQGCIQEVKNNQGMYGRGWGWRYNILFVLIVFGLYPYFKAYLWTRVRLGRWIMRFREYNCRFVDGGQMRK